MNLISRPDEKDQDWLLILSLILGVSSTDPISIVISVGLIDIGKYFSVPISIVGQLGTLKSIVGIVAALIIGALSVKYGYKKILTIGLLLNTLFAFACGSVPSFSLLIIFYSLTGIAGAMVTPMTDAYIGECFTGDNRSKVVGRIFGLRTLSFLLGVQIIGFLTGRLSWQYSFLLFVVPYSLLSLIIALKVLPNIKSTQSVKRKLEFTEGYRTIFSSRSAVSCLIANTLAHAAWGGNVVYFASYLRDRFLLSTGQASLALSGLAFGVFVGSYFGGSLVNKYGRKKMVVFTLSIVSLLLFGLMNLPNLWITILVLPIFSIIGGVRFTATNSLTLEQAPSVRGTMMSINSAALSLGWALGSVLGGLALLYYGWSSVGIFLGLSGIIATSIYKLLTNEPPLA